MNRLTWHLEPGTPAEALGLLPLFIFPGDPRPAAEQLQERYAHGGGWSPLQGWRLNRETREAQYPGDTRLCAIAWARLRSEELLFFPYAWLAIVQPDGAFAISRID